MAQTTRRIVQYRVSQGDSLERLALRFMGDPEAWLQLAILNGLDYPYISDDFDFVREVKATGEVVFTRETGTTDPIIIPEGYVVATAGDPAKQYVTTETATIGIGDDTETVPVEAVEAGRFGNTAGLTVTELSEAIDELEAVANPDAITGGVLLNVKLPGDSLLVYSDQQGVGEVGIDTQALSQDDFYTTLLGIDVALDNLGDLSADSRGGLAVVGGIENFRQALIRRFGTPLAFYVFNAGYGSNVEKSIGERGEAFWLQRTRVEVERTVRSDPRTEDVQNLKLAFESGTLTVSLDILTIGEREPRNLVVSFRPPGA